MRPRSIDIDARITWPLEVRKHAEGLANRLRGSTHYTSDLDAPPGSADRFRRLFVGHRTRAYHATRLLEHEAQAIGAQGLRKLSKELVVERIDRAHELGHLASGDRDKLLKGNVFAEGKSRGRVGHASLFLSKTPLNRAVHGVWPVLSTWGGEAIYMAHGGHSLRETLRTMGTPTVVVVDVDLGPDPLVHGIYPDLWKLFVGRLLGLEPAWADLFYKESVPSEAIMDFWQPGDPEYDMYRLPRN